MEEDWYDNQVYFETDLSVKRCEPSDFGDDPLSRDIFHTWITDKYQFELFCPDMSAHIHSLYNQRGAMKSKSIIFRIEKCQDVAGQSNYCKSDEELNKFINELTVQLWVLETKIDMRYFEGKSFTRNQKLYSETQLRIKDEIPNE